MGKTTPKQREKRARQGSSGSDEHQHGEHSESDLIVELFARIKTLEDNGQALTARMNDLQSQLDAARGEVSTLTKKVKELEESLEFTQKEQDDVVQRVETCESEQFRQEEELLRQAIYSRRWNLIFHGIEEQEEEHCENLVKHVLSSDLNIPREKANTIMFCGVHRLGKKRRNSTKPRPVIARFTCRSERDSVWRRKSMLKDSRINLSEDLPKRIRDVRKKVLIPALKKARQEDGNKATIVGDRLVVNGKRYTSDNIPKRWQADNNSRKNLSAE